MGRKPHPLIQEYFARGAKLEDSSNRYQHTCKSCGEKFPKGRIDGLLAHLLRKCPAISREDRQRILLELVDKPNQNGSYNPLAVSIRNEQLSVEQEENSSSYIQNMSALETLAEVSRQQLGTTAEQQHTDQLATESPINPKKRKRRWPDEAQQRLQNTFAVRSGQHFEPDLLSIGQSQDDTTTTTQDQLFSDVAQYASQDMSSVAPTAQMIPDQLALTASAASQIISTTSAMPEPVLPNNHANENAVPTNEANNQLNVPSSDPIDPRLDQVAQSFPSTSNSQFPHDRPLILQPRSAPTNPDFPLVHFVNNFLLGHGSNRKVRGRFSDTRRKEVQEVRKQGACIRCRMLKKPCSGGTPCATCQNVESARLWKIPCVRARIADEFDLFSAGVQAVLAFREINQAKHPETFRISNRELVATHFPENDSDYSIRLKSVYGQSKQDMDHTFSFVGSGLGVSDIELADTENQDISAKLSNYFQSTKPLMTEQEDSTFIHATLQVATELVSQKMDPLLRRALDLWVAVRVLLDPFAVWSFFSVLSSTSDDDDDDDDDLNANVDLHDRYEISPSYRYLNHRLLTQQLKGFVEKHASQVAKQLMNDLEKRLLQRQQNSSQHFETFITAIILLNSIERMCWLYHIWATKFELSDMNPSGVDLAERDQTETSSARGIWPLAERLPNEFVEKGSSIANLIAMLLKMRGIPPPIEIGQDGVLRLSGSKPTSSKRTYFSISQQNDDHGTSNDELVAHLAQAAAAATVEDPNQAEEVDDSTMVSPSTAARGQVSALTSPQPSSRRFKTSAYVNQTQPSIASPWFEKINVTEEQLKRAQAAEIFDEKDHRCWDLRFVARLLLPDD